MFIVDDCCAFGYRWPRNETCTTVYTKQRPRPGVRWTRRPLTILRRTLSSRSRRRRQPATHHKPRAAATASHPAACTPIAAARTRRARCRCRLRRRRCSSSSVVRRRSSRWRHRRRTNRGVGPVTSTCPWTRWSSDTRAAPEPRPECHLIRAPGPRT